MEKSKKYYNKLDRIRLISCLAVLFYHFHILKGGYLAVCTFFVLSGYLSFVSFHNQESFSLKEYYCNRLKKIYFPLVLITFLTIAVVSLSSNFIWLNLKREVPSVLFGYNNFWQLSANLDYFTRNINSPLTHLWYTSILIQFDVVFPFFYLFLRKIKQKTNPFIPFIITGTLALASMAYFYWLSLNNNIMPAYYHTFSRLFSILFGLFLGMVHEHTNGRLFILKKEGHPLREKTIFYAYLLVLLAMFLLVESSSSYFALAMIVTTIISCRLIEYATIETKEEVSGPDKIVKLLASISYEIYLVQYPVLFLFQDSNISNNLKLPLSLITIVLISYLLHSCRKTKEKRHPIFRKIITIILLGISLLGAYQYIKAEDHTKEMKKLEEQLSKNEQVLKQKQEAYRLEQKQKEKNWQEKLEELNNEQVSLQEVVKNLPVVGIGDSIMLGAIDSLYVTFPNGYFDAAVSRTAWVAGGIINHLKNQNLLTDTIILNLGSNGDCSDTCKRDILETCREKEVFWINVVNDEEVHFNDSLIALSKEYDNLHIIDWNESSKNHPEYFILDRIHLTDEGKIAYAQTIYDHIYQVYLKKYNEKKEEIIKNHDEENRKTIAFYGNDLLLNALPILTPRFENVEFIIKDEKNSNMLNRELEQLKKEKKLKETIVFVFDKTMKINTEEYSELIHLCQSKKVYIVVIDETVKIPIQNEDQVTIINLAKETKDHKEYLMADGIHLTDKGNEKLVRMLIEAIQNERG